MKTGDINTIEAWADNHYKTGAQASIYIGKDPPTEIAEAYDLNTAMHMNAVRAVKPGKNRRGISSCGQPSLPAPPGAD